MPGATADGEDRADRTRPLADAYRRFAADAGTSPLSARVAGALGGSPEALRALAALPARRRRPPVVLAALHDLALAGRAPALAAAYVSGDGEAAAAGAVDTLLGAADAVAATAARRPVLSDEAGHPAVLYPALAEAARRAGAGAVGLVGVGRPAGLDLLVDRVGVSYGDGRFLGDPSSPVQVSARVVGDRAVPARSLPPVVARVCVDADPLDGTDPDGVRWLRACLPPDRPERRAELDAQLALAGTDPPVPVRGDVAEVLPDAVARVPTGALPVVVTAWSLARLRPERRLHFLHRLDEAAAGRPVAWVSVEGVGVAPGVPTLGDRPASGHSTIGVTVAGRSARQAEAVGRCWQRGRVLSWLVDS
ncbi:hypothetical protein SAMN04488107_2275 [Geodermatophilus saharensis]|uniref:DUF2332 domain-containing protein n=1 Tax=Geodermatophilus saharensis TaxID=1137994 RepID=A0A239DQP2_9ACTN|nr:DUF2332 domain-containing protein [Geodermatophilus saharensis]SNS33904.1 hypothetical protein SAMN04488107_2275 [Geodermatophilus saharensis]